MSEDRIIFGDIGEGGRELMATELLPRTVYVLEKADRPLVTMWFKGMLLTEDPDAPIMAEFYAGVTGVTLWLFLTPEDTLCDDSGAQIHVFEFLGEKK